MRQLGDARDSARDSAREKMSMEMIYDRHNCCTTLKFYFYFSKFGEHGFVANVVANIRNSVFRSVRLINMFAKRVNFKFDQQLGVRSIIHKPQVPFH